MRNLHWLIEALEHAEQFLRPGAAEANAFGLMLIVDKMPASPGDVGLLKEIVLAGTQSVLRARGFDPTSFLQQQRAAEEAARTSSAQADEPASVVSAASDTEHDRDVDCRPAADVFDAEIITGEEP